MTREEAIVNLNMISVSFIEPVTKEQRTLIDDTFDMAIKALEQESVLDNIKAEILDEAEYAYADFEQYKDDDFRYGLKRAVEIIDKYKAESEEYRNDK